MSDLDDTNELPTLIATREDWTKQAVCNGMDTNFFFPERGEATKDAKALCATCPVKAECLDYALRTCQRFGIWGGTSERERRQIRRDMRPEGEVRRGPAKGTGKYDPAEIARVACIAIEGGGSAAEAVAERYRIAIGQARSLVSRARCMGYEIPYNYRGWVA